MSRSVSCEIAKNVTDKINIDMEDSKICYAVHHAVSVKVMEGIEETVYETYKVIEEGVYEQATSEDTR